MSERTKGLTRQQMCDRLAMEFGDGWIVNLGIGIPTLCSNFDFGDKEIIFHSENGVIGYGPLARYEPGIGPGVAVGPGEPLGIGPGVLDLVWERRGARINPYPLLRATRPADG